jgi:hypothetical protein
MSLVFYIDPNACDTYEKAVLLAMADHGNDEGKSIYPAYQRLAWKCSMTERGVAKVIERLQSKNLVSVVRHGSGTVTNEYELNTEAIEAISVNPRGKLASTGVESGSTLPSNPVPPRIEPGSTESSYNHQRTTNSASPKTLSGDKEPPSISIDVNDQCPNFLALKKADKLRTLFDCPFCGTEQVIGVYADHCPVTGCGARIIWQNNHLYAKRAKARATDAKAKERNRRKSDDPAVAYLETAADAKVKPEEVREIQNFVTRNGLPRFMALVDDTKTKAKDSGQWGRSIVVTVVNRLLFWGNGSPAEKKPSNEPVEQAVNLPKGTVLAIRPEASAKLKELGIE